LLLYFRILVDISIAIRKFSHKDLDCHGKILGFIEIEREGGVVVL